MQVTTCVFDAYGTLFDVAAAARRAAEEPDCAAIKDTWPQIAETWRQKQLQYTWLRASAGIHTDFWTVTRDGLDWTLEAHGVVEDRLRERLLQLYWELDAFPEVPETLRKLEGAGYACAILSNASQAMLEAAIESAGIGGHLEAALSADQVGAFKPDPRVYDLVPAAFGVARREVLFVSSNGWDAWAGAAFGFRTAWVNRKGEPLDRLSVRPDHVIGDLSDIPGLLA